MGEHFKRRKFFINKRLQVHYMVSMLIPMLILIIFIGLVMYYSQKKFIVATTKEMGRELKNIIITNQLYENDDATRDRNIITQLKKRIDSYKAGEVATSGAMLQTAYKILFLGLVVVIIELAFLTIFISHKVAGPVYRLDKFAEGIRGGDFTSRIYLRKGDELVEVASDFNRTGDFLRNTFQTMLTINEKLLSLAKKGAPAEEVSLLEKELREVASKIKVS